jgi:AraC-like DNA-binding protein
LTVSLLSAKVSREVAMNIAEQDIGLVTLAGPEGRPVPGAIVQDRFDLDCPWHHHDMHQIQYAFEGSIALEDAHGRHLLPRSLAGWIPAGVTHRDSLRRVRSVSLLLARDMVPDAGDRVRVIRVSPLMREMIAEAARWPIDQPQDETGRVFFQAFACLCRDWIADEAPFTLPTSTDPALEAAIAHTRTHLADATFADAARAAGLSPRTLRRRFRAELGAGWENYRRRARLLAAVEALTDGDRSVAQIAADVGFESQSAFAKAFHELTGETPRAFRLRAGGRRGGTGA